MGVKQNLREGKKSYGMLVKTMRSPVFVNIAKQAGVDYLMYDLEHAELSFQTIADLILYGNAIGIESMVRVPEVSKSNVSRILDIGARGIMIPYVETKEQAEELVHWACYKPLGNRGYSGGANTDYVSTNGKFVENMQYANDNNVIIVQIESQKGVDNIEEILSVEGIDQVTIGTNDLAVSLETYGDKDSPKLIEALDKVLAACIKYNKGFSCGGTAKIFERYKDYITMYEGVTDIDIMKAGLKNYINDCQSK